MSEDEHIIRNEAKDFFKFKVEQSRERNAIAVFHLIKERLEDFYSAESKAIFIDELVTLMDQFLSEHRKKAHGGNANPDCSIEQKLTKIQFYIRQELSILPAVAHLPIDKSAFDQRTKVFISYSHQDKEWLAHIQRHFKPFLKNIEIWDDSKIDPGKKWRAEIRNAIDETRVAILLISTDFLGSDFIATDELPPLLAAAEENGAVILSVILKPCLFEEFPQLNQFQAINPPSRPIVKMTELEQEETFVNLVRQTKKILEEK